uniref:asparagine synthase (glutamine-hydrolyzing) n=1 Tax=uncultured bacterium esnapd14 TaxID=1366594 RepID=S5TUN5_9BACT|nr:asparagine synthetase [uncultured bacterium esnapd14]
MAAAGRRDGLAVCGIVAVVSPEGGLAEADVAPAVRCLAHRGPDGTGSWISPCGRAALGHTRLAVIDLAGGRQPMHTHDGAYHLVANAEFYGYEAIRAELLRQGCPLKTAADTEIALYLYAEHGAEAMQRLRGEFAFAIWDQRRGELFAARDRFGIKPLYYVRHRGRIVLASELKALRALGVAARWDAGCLAAHLLVCHAPDRTLFEGIHQVPPGCWLRTDGTRVRVERYWDLDFPTADELPSGGDRAAHLARVRDAVVDSIHVRLRADVPVAAHLSGGLDSGTIVGVAAAHIPLATFTVRFDDDPLDEGPMAQLVAKHAGTVHTEIPFRRADFAGHIRRTIDCGQMLQENSHGTARLLQSEAIRRHGYSVVLAGEGGDEVFAGYPQSHRDLALSLSAPARERAGTAYARLLADDAAPAYLRRMLSRLGFIPSWIVDRHLTVAAQLGPLLHRDFARQVAECDPCGDLLDGATAQLAGRTPYHQSTYLFYKTWLCNYLLAAERLDMAHALEVRLPFLDHHLIEVVKGTPLQWYVGEGPKPLLRDAMRDFHAPDVPYAGKRPFFAPPATADPLALATMREILSDAILDSLPFFDPAAVRTYVDRLAALPPRRRVGHERMVQLLTGIVLLTKSLGVKA